MNMKQLKRYFTYIILLTLLGFVTGCASTHSEDPSQTPRTSSIPWNRPQGWESQGQLGSMMNSGGFGNGR